MGDYRYRVGNFECGFYGEEEPLSSHAVLGEVAILQVDFFLYGKRIDRNCRFF